MDDLFVGLTETLSPDVNKLVEQLRSLIKQYAPEAVETFNGDQKHLVYSSGKAHDKDFILLAPKRDFVLLVFPGSKKLVDADGLLGGDGKQVRFMTIKNTAQAENPALSQLIGSAWANAVNTAAS